MIRVGIRGRGEVSPRDIVWVEGMVGVVRRE